MHPRALFWATFALTAHAANIILSNDDGWAEKNIRVLYDTLTTAGESVVISAPAEDESGSGSDNAPPTEVTDGCEFDSCPPGSPAVGSNSSMPRFNYVNSYPATAMLYGIQNSSLEFFGGPPDLAVAGFNVGDNTGLSVLISGTVGAATEASLEGIPAIAFSGSTGSQVAWTTATQTYQSVYAALSTNVTQTLIASGKPYLPDDIWLNVNYPSSNALQCSSAEDISFVLSRINAATLLAPADVETCGSRRLPVETLVVDFPGCYASISVGNATDKSDASAADQAVVLEKLQSILSCLP
ncbi:5'/3'-nucleotidase sure family protein [Cryphonectria parasitica EP155]|uniref:5'/3'-nucleotidase sure family protein n=1 Tax=Cryphonectria parasitica (strain ATCC 38755 / EP155) TaxID=660469 RepID=A0A9P4XZW5_CRYP1|nr:5'/3'-nucleotidase sure family protein [Cryphonectria parasitica EP155]KAF3763976.1 5'/3'-nucleotidase sure family protein [Cryphonectria parasitica EP155]